MFNSSCKAWFKMSLQIDSSEKIKAVVSYQLLKTTFRFSNTYQWFLMLWNLLTDTKNAMTRDFVYNFKIPKLIFYGLTSIF